MKKKLIFSGIVTVVFGVSLGIAWFVLADKETRHEVLKIKEVWFDDCRTAEDFNLMAFWAAQAYTPGMFDRCGEMNASECRILLLRLSVEAGCTNTTLAECDLGEVLFSLGRYQEAIEPLQGCVAKVDSANDLWYLAVAYSKVGDHSKARRAKKDLHRVRKRFPNRVDDVLGPLPF